MNLVALTQQTGAEVKINPGQILYTEQERSGTGSRVVLSNSEAIIVKEDLGKIAGMVNAAFHA
jgi:hypothetical protein